MKYEAIREECCKANIDLPETGLVDLTFGNVSVLDPEAGAFAIKPSGVDYDALRPEDMVVLDLDGNILDGSLRPSSDTPTHRCLYREFGDKGIRSIVHTHSRCAAGFAQAGRGIPCLGTTHADYFSGDVPVTRMMTADEVESAYEWNTGLVILERFAELDPTRFPAVLVNGHGPFAWGPTGRKAVENAFALEAVADMALKSLSLDPGLSGIPDHLLKKHFLRKHGKDAYYGQR